MTTRLTEHFVLEEFIRSATAIHYRIDNKPDEEVVKRLEHLCTRLLEPLRLRFGVIRITSGYRCKRLNQILGGAANSQHLTGEAADIHIPNVEVGRRMVQFIEHYLPFDQALLEYRRRDAKRWLHVSLYMDESLNRRMARYDYPV